MKRPIQQLHKSNSFPAKLILIALLMTSASLAIAEESNVAYVDSVFKWGAWELDIEPAAGGLSAPTTRALNARGSKVTLRTNSIAALAPSPQSSVIPATPSTPVVPATPSTPATPAAPTIPAVTPISPSVPIPVGAP